MPQGSLIGKFVVIQYTECEAFSLKREISLLTNVPFSLWDFRDLKRDVAKKLEKLERRTQKAIAELIREYTHSPDT